MKTGMKPLLWSGAALLLLFMLAVPLLNVIALPFMMIPFVVLCTILPTRSFILHLLPIGILAAIIVGPGVLIVGLFFLLPAVMMGYLYRKGAPAARVIRMVTVLILAMLMLELLVFEVILDLSLLDEMSDMLRTSLNEVMTQGMLDTGWSAEDTDFIITSVIHMIPLTFIMISFVYTVFTQYIARKIVIRNGMDVPGFLQAKDWKLPRVLVVYYLIAYVIRMFLDPTDFSFISIALINLVPLLGYLFAIQGIGFVFFIAHHRKWHRAVPVLLSIPILLFPPLSLLGVLDTAFPIRKRFIKQ